MARQPQFPREAMPGQRKQRLVLDKDAEQLMPQLLRQQRGGLDPRRIAGEAEFQQHAMPRRTGAHSSSSTPLRALPRCTAAKCASVASTRPLMLP